MEHSLPQQNKFWNFCFLPALSLILLILSIIIENLWFLTIFSLIPLFFCVSKMSLKISLFASFIVGWIYFSVLLYPLTTLNTWWWYTSHIWLIEHKQVVFLGVTTTSAIFLSLGTFVLFFFIYKKFLQNREYGAVIVLPFFWILIEYIRVKIISDLEWGLFGQPLAHNLFFARLGSFGGIFTLSCATLFLNFCFFLVFKNYFENKKIKDYVVPITFITIFVLLVFLNNYFVTQPILNKNSLSVSLITPNIKTADILEQSAFDHILFLILQSLEHNPDLVILPENIFPNIIIDEKDLLPINYENSELVKNNFNRIVNISKENKNVSFIIGLHTQESGAQKNSAFVFENGKIVSMYDKEYLLPFTEKKLLFFSSANIEPLTRGRERETVSTQHGEFTMLICSEALVNKKNNRVVTINISNDNVIDSPRFKLYSKMLVQMRAIEQRETLIRVSKGGFSGIFDKTGQEIPLQNEFNGEILSGTISIP